MSSELQQLQQIEAAVTQLYQSENQDARNQADAALAGMFGSGNVSSTSTTVATHIVTGRGGWCVFVRDVFPSRGGGDGAFVFSKAKIGDQLLQGG